MKQNKVYEELKKLYPVDDDISELEALADETPESEVVMSLSDIKKEVTENA